jgi:hypothetical protein
MRSDGAEVSALDVLIDCGRWLDGVPERSVIAEIMRTLGILRRRISRVGIEIAVYWRRWKQCCVGNRVLPVVIWRRIIGRDLVTLLCLVGFS